MEKIEERLLSLERQFTALLRCLDKEMHDRMWEIKMVMRKENGNHIRFSI